ncbi:MAG: radical SAM protein, partial [bacterium]|nr:radical SAM protein [bacterium]
ETLRRQVDAFVKPTLLIDDLVIAENYCNQKCTYCLTDTSEFKESHKTGTHPVQLKKYHYSEETGADGLKSRLDKIDNAIAGRFNAKILKISGGEVFLVKNIETYILDATKKFDVVQVLTNGVLLNKTFLEKAAGTNICLQVSLDHHTGAGNSYRTGSEKVLQKVLDNIGLIVAHNIPLEINCVLTDRNTGIIDEFAAYLNRYPGKVTLFPFPIRGKERERYYPTIEQTAGVQRLLDQFETYRSILPPRPYLRHLLDFLKTGKRNVRCSLPLLSVGIFDDGVLTPCPNVWLTDLGNLVTGDSQAVLDKVGKDKIYPLATSARNPITFCKTCFTPWEILNLYVEGSLTLDEAAETPLYGYPKIREILPLLKKSIKRYTKEN